MTPLQKLLALALSLSVAIVLAACGRAAAAPPASVNGEEITDQQLQDNMALYTFLAGLQQQPCGQPIDAKETPESACARFTLSNLIQEDLIRQYATANDVAVDDKVVTDAIASLEQSLGGPDKLQTQLDAEGLTKDELTAFAARLLLFNEVQKAVGKEQVTDQKLQEAYAQAQSSFTQLHARHILLKSEAEAEKVRAQVTDENFAELAKKYSIDPSAKQNGGDLGTMAASQLDPTFVATALALKPGEISQPVQTQFGWHVIQLVETQTPPLEQVREQLELQLSSQAFNTWLLDQLKTADITVDPKYGRLDRSNGQVLPIRSTATSKPSPSVASPAATP